MVLLVAKSGVVVPQKGENVSSEDTRLVLPPRESAKFSADTAGFPQEAGIVPSEGTSLFLSPRESAEFSADTAAQTQEARLTPFPGTGEFRPRRASAFLAAFGGGNAPLPGRGQKGVQDTCGFLYPLLRLPLIFRWLLSAASQLKTRAAIKTALSSGALRRRLGLASRSISAHISARQRVPVGWIGNRLCDLSGLLP